VVAHGFGRRGRELHCKHVEDAQGAEAGSPSVSRFKLRLVFGGGAAMAALTVVLAISL